jgi:hypothetical protein
MTKSPAVTTIAQLDARLHEQAQDVAALRFALDVQGNRFARMFTEPPPAPARRQLPAVALRIRIAR